MPLGILEDDKLQHVPGTAPLKELGHTDIYSGIDPSLLKHDPTGNIVLVPQPSDSPRDPYNWPRKKKELFTLTYAIGSGCVGALGPLLGAALVPLAEEFGVPLATFVSGVQGGTIVSIAVGSLIFNSLAVKYGKRPIYLATTLGVMVSCFWAAGSKSFASLVASRVFAGLCMAPMEALIPASIADIWFVHERGYRTSVFNLGLVGGINLSAPIAGAVIEYGSFRIAFNAIGGAFAIVLIMVFFWMPESAYKRDNVLSFDTGKKTTSPNCQKKFRHSEHAVIQNGEESASSAEQLAETPNSWARELLPYSGYVDNASFWNTLVRPFYLLLSPVLLYAILLFTISISWLVGVGLAISQIFSAPPYSFSVGAVGALNLSSFVAGLIGTIVAGPLIDGVATKMSKINGGIFEPEFRLPVIITYIIFMSTGYFAWGQSLHAEDPWPVPIIVGLGLINLGFQLGTTGLITYVVDCHGEKSGEAFAAMNFIKNFFSFGLTFYMNGWIDSQGVRNCFFAIAGITIACTLFTVPMYIYGKRARSWVHRHKIADRL